MFILFPNLIFIPQVSALCAVAEAHLGVQEQRQAWNENFAQGKSFWLQYVNIDHLDLIFSSFSNHHFFPQQRKLMGSSAQISSGVCRCGSQEQVPEEGSGRFRSSGVCWCRFRRRVPEGSGEFRCKMAKVPEAGSGRFWIVPV